jgi:hypothetical protein
LIVTEVRMRNTAANRKNAADRADPRVSKISAQARRRHFEGSR